MFSGTLADSVVARKLWLVIPATPMQANIFLTIVPSLFLPSCIAEYQGLQASSDILGSGQK